MSCKSQWNSLIKKYKSFFRYTTGEGTGEEATTEDPNDWPFYEALHSYAAQKDNFHPSYLIDSTEGAYSMQQEDLSSSLPATPTPPIVDGSSFLFEDSASSSMSSPSMSTPTSSSAPQSRASSSRPPVRAADKFHSLETYIRKRDKKTNKRMSSLLSVFAQMAQVDYPQIDVSGLLVASSDSDSE